MLAADATALGAVEVGAAAVGEVEAVGRAKVGDVVADVLAARPSKLAARPSAGAGSGERAPCPRGCISRRPTSAATGAPESNTEGLKYLGQNISTGLRRRRALVDRETGTFAPVPPPYTNFALLARTALQHQGVGGPGPRATNSKTIGFFADPSSICAGNLVVDLLGRGASRIVRGGHRGLGSQGLGPRGPVPGFNYLWPKLRQLGEKFST